VAGPQGSVFDAIRKWLDDEGILYRHLHHEPTYTSEQAARVRGEDIRVGGKALLMKVGEDFRLFVLSAGLKFDSAAVRHYFGIQRLRFATKQELHDLTGLVPGCVPPFGRPILPFDLFVDESIPANDRIAFNAGSLTDSIIMGIDDYMRLAQPVIFRFAAPS
jgi:Ala-tRNA(Pro) deacylase